MFKFHHSQPTDQRTRCWETGPKKSVALQQFFRKIAQELLLQALPMEQTTMGTEYHRMPIKSALHCSYLRHVFVSNSFSRDWLIWLSAVTILQHTVTINESKMNPHESTNGGENDMLPIAWNNTQLRHHDLSHYAHQGCGTGQWSSPSSATARCLVDNGPSVELFPRSRIEVRPWPVETVDLQHLRVGLIMSFMSDFIICYPIFADMMIWCKDGEATWKLTIHKAS